MGDIEVLKEDIKILKENNPSEFQDVKKEIKVALADVSTDDEGHHSREESSPKIQKLESDYELLKEKLKPLDKWNNSDVSFLLEEEKFSELKELFNLPKEYNNVTLLKQLALQMIDPVFLKECEVLPSISLRIFSEARDQLNLIGENITDEFDKDEIII